MGTRYRAVVKLEGYFIWESFILTMVKGEDQFGRYTYDEYTVFYRGEKYWDVKTKKR